MKIAIVNGAATVEMLKSEKAAMAKTIELCKQLNTWLDDEVAGRVATDVSEVAEKYCPPSTEEVQKVVANI